jgi:hypothetical protein
MRRVEHFRSGEDRPTILEQEMLLRSLLLQRGGTVDTLQSPREGNLVIDTEEVPNSRTATIGKSLPRL